MKNILQRSRGKTLARVASLILPVIVISWPSGAVAQRFATIKVVALDYAYQAPTTLPAGLTAFALDNQGKVRHEVAIVRLQPGVTVDSMVHAAGPARLALIDFIGILVAAPSETPQGRILVDLTPGRTYVLFCNFQDAPDKPRHLTMGMFTSIQVK